MAKFRVTLYKHMHIKAEVLVNALSSTTAKEIAEELAYKNQVDFSQGSTLFEYEATDAREGTGPRQSPEQSTKPE